MEDNPYQSPISENHKDLSGTEVQFMFVLLAVFLAFCVPVLFVLLATAIFPPLNQFPPSVAYFVITVIYLPPIFSILAARQTGVYLNSNTVMIAIAFSILQLVIISLCTVIGIWMPFSFAQS